MSPADWRESGVARGRPRRQGVGGRSWAGLHAQQAGRVRRRPACRRRYARHQRPLRHHRRRSRFPARALAARSREAHRPADQRRRVRRRRQHRMGIRKKAGIGVVRAVSATSRLRHATPTAGACPAGPATAPTVISRITASSQKRRKALATRRPSIHTTAFFLHLELEPGHD